jgi:hypothetical protein
MGWASGSRVMSEIIAAIQPHLPDENARKEVYKILIKVFEDDDWDTQDECEGEDPAFDAAMQELHPDWYEYDEVGED